MSLASASIAEFLLAGKESSRVALLTMDREWSYGDLQHACDGVAQYLVTHGRKGDRVLLVDGNSLFWVAAYLGILKAGLVCVPLPTSIAPQELDYILGVTEPRFAFLQARFAAVHALRFDRVSVVTDQTLARCEIVPIPAGAEKHSSRLNNELPTITPNDLAALMFTSGSTGRPRGVMVSHRNIIANTESIIQYLALTESDRIMTVLPFHYCFGTSLLHTHLRVGGSLVLDSRFMYPEKILQRMLEAECTGFAGVPSHFQILLGKSSLRKKTFPHLRYVQQAGGHLAPTFIRELRRVLPTTQVFVMYGQTEATARLAYLPPGSLDQKLGSIGKAIPGVSLRVINESGAEVGPGEVGEIVAEGANVTQGYWRAPEESANSFRDGRLYTGDLATVDDDGFIYVVDRAKDFLKCGGKRVSCRQLEEQLLEFDGVLEAAVIGVPDDTLGEAVKAFVVPRHTESPDHLVDRLHQFCKKHIPFQVVPKEIVVIHALPKNDCGKVLKQELRSHSN